MPNGISKKIFVSYKYKDSNVHPLSEYAPGKDTDYSHTPRHYVDKIIDTIGQEHIYKGEKSGEDIGHLADDTIDSKLKEKIFDSSVTLVLISPNMWDKSKYEKDQWIPNEICYSLRNKKRGDKTSKANAMLAVVLPDSNGSYDYAVVHYSCVTQWQTGSFFAIIRNNMFNRSTKKLTKCDTCGEYHHAGADHSYMHPVKWSDFIADHNHYIDHALSLRDQIDDFEVSKVHE